MATIHVGAVRFEEWPEDFSNAFVIEPEGFNMSVGTRGEVVERPRQHGSFDLPVFRASRVIDIKGTIIASSEFYLARMTDQLFGVVGDGSSTFLSLDDKDTGNRGCRVRLGTAPNVRRFSSGLEAAFQIQFVANDPRMVGAQRSFAGSSVQVHHYGNFPASPVIEVAGPRTGPYTITGPGGRQVVVSQSLTAGQTHRIDFADAGLSRNGVRQFGQVPVFQPWTVPAGVRVPVSISSGSMTVHVTDTYM